jgi:hypothetical protein
MMDKVIAILIAAAIAFVTIAISLRVQPLRHILMGAHAPHPNKAG